MVVAEAVEDATNTNKEVEAKESVLSGTVDAKGTLEVDLKFVLPIRNGADIHMELSIMDSKKNEDTIYFHESESKLTLGDQEVTAAVRKRDKYGNLLLGEDKEQSIMYYGITVYGLEKGTYTLTLSGDGYKSYTTSITIDQSSKRVSLSNTKGMFEAGDVNGDGVVDAKDITNLLQHMGSKASIYDLNRDGVCDIADLNYITAILYGTKNSESVVNTAAIFTEKDLTVTGVFQENATLNDLLTDQGSLLLSPKKEGDVSKDNPIEVTLEMKQPMKASELRLETGLEHIPLQMNIIITDEKGLTRIIEKTYAPSEDIATFTDKASANTIVIDLKGQIAIKKVTIQITETKKDTLAEIAQVEFLNNVYESVPVPVVEKPTNVKVTTGSESATVTYQFIKQLIMSFI